MSTSHGVGDMLLVTPSKHSTKTSLLLQFNSRIQMSRTLNRSAGVSFTVVQSQVRESGRVLGDLCKEHFIPSVEDLVLAMEQPDHPMRTLLLFVLNLRARRRARGILSEVTALLQSPQASRPRWFRLLMREVFAIYCALRRAAAPRAQQPQFQPQTATPVGRTVARQLQFHGISIPQTAKWQLSRQASYTLRLLWRRMAGRGVVMWFDNFYKPRMIHNPARMRGTLNATVMSVLGAVAMPRGHCWPEVRDLPVRLQRAVDWLTQAFPPLFRRVEAVAALAWQSHQFRVPLDMPRHAVSSVPWRPFSLNDDVVQTQRQLLKILVFCHRIVTTHVQPPMPLLVDENIAYRVQKLCYAEPLQSWAVREKLRDLPVLYGVWHPYKYVLEVLYRRFLALFAFLLRGTVPVGDALPSAVKLRSMEMWVGAMLLVSLQDRRAVNQLAHRLKQQRASVDRHVEQLVQEWHRRPAANVLGSTALVVDDILAERVEANTFTTQRDHVPQYAHVRMEHARQLQRRIREAWRARQLLNVQMQCAEGLDVLLNQYAPVCLVLGTMVRQCTWVWTQNGTGRHARELLCNCLLVLVRLSEGNEHKLEYVKSLGAALLLWTDWHDSVPASWFCEESNEAALSRLSKLCRRHTQHITTTDVHELWMNVEPGPGEPHDLPTGGVPQDTAAAVAHNVQQFIQNSGRGVSWLPYNPQGPYRLSHAVDPWPETACFPEGLQRRPGAPHLRDLMRHIRRTLHFQRPPSESFMQDLDQTFARRSETETQRDTDELSGWLATSQGSQRYRS